jgi:hypothetical protein
MIARSGFVDALIDDLNSSLRFSFFDQFFKHK